MHREMCYNETTENSAENRRERKTMKNANERNAPIAVFDSGVGGISVLSELVRQMPQESFLYYGDSANAPYGTRTAEEVLRLTRAAVERFVNEWHAKAVVIACNTATGVAIADLRDTYRHFPIIGIEPAIKPAVRAFPGGRILVMATPVTLTSEKFRHLMEKYAMEAEIVPAPCPRLARMIEAGELTGPHLAEYLQEELHPLLEKGADGVVLGCTHYPFVKDTIAAVSGAKSIFDGGAGTARETQKQLMEHGLLTDSAEAGQVTILNSDVKQIPFCEHLLRLALERMKSE